MLRQEGRIADTPHGLSMRIPRHASIRSLPVAGTLPPVVAGQTLPVSHLAHEVQQARARAQLLALKRVGARLDAWIALNDQALPSRGRWVELAAELPVTPEALYRELARRRILR